MKCAKVIACFFGVRRIHNSNNSSMVNFIEEMVQNELSIENGFPTDVIFMVNNCDDENLNNILNKHKNKQTKNGKIKIYNRENLGGSFGAYLDSYIKFENEYDYWFFCEDDVYIYKTNYIKNFIDYLNSNSDFISFVSLAPISTNPIIHSGGGCGLTSTLNMKEHFSKEIINNIFQYYKESKQKVDINKNLYLDLNNFEVIFTNTFTLKNKTLSNHKDFNPLCLNFLEHSGQRNYQHMNNSNLEFIYTVGTTKI